QRQGRGQRVRRGAGGGGRASRHDARSAESVSGAARQYEPRRQCRSRRARARKNLRDRRRQRLVPRDGAHRLRQRAPVGCRDDHFDRRGQRAVPHSVMAQRYRYTVAFRCSGRVRSAKMTLKPITEAFSIWMATVAGWLVALSDRRGPGRNVRLIEEEGGRFKVEIVRKRGSVTSPRERIRIVDGAVVGALPAPVKSALQGSRAELVLRPGRFLSRPLELPKRAGEFIEGIVRAQIDRLTPWTANEA